MSKLSKSPQRYSFQRDLSIENYLNGGTVITDELLEFLEECDQEDSREAALEQNPAWAEDNLEYDLRSTDWILDKVRSNSIYAQNLYAALCNNTFQRADTWPILKGYTWSCSWRYAGGIVANMRQEGDYIDWYCSGIRDPDEYTNDTVAESIVTDEVREDLAKLGWMVVDED